MTNVAQLVIDHLTIRCYLDWRVDSKTGQQLLSGERLLAAEAMRLLMRLDLDLRNAHVEWNEDRFRRVMRARKRAVVRLQRRWGVLDPQPAIPLGSLRRRRNANIALMTNYSNARLATLRELASSFRHALESCERTKLSIGLQGFPRGACGDVSLLLGKYLQEKGVGTAEYVCGTEGDQSHAWLELDGIVIDITADQFDSVNDHVVVTTNSTWHKRFDEKSRRAVSFDECDAHTLASLDHAYREIVSAAKISQ